MYSHVAGASVVMSGNSVAMSGNSVAIDNIGLTFFLSLAQNKELMRVKLDQTGEVMEAEDEDLEKVRSQGQPHRIDDDFGMGVVYL